MDLLKDNVRKLYFRFLVPSLGSAMVMSIYTLTDAIVIGKGVGADALAALSITTPLLCILMAVGILFGVGGSVQMNIQRGTGDTEKANAYFTSSLLSLGIITLVFWAIYSTAMSPMLELMRANETLFPYAEDYMRNIIYFLPFAVFSNFFAVFVRADNDPNRAMAGVLVGGALNIVLDILLVFPFHMGIGGAALASVIGMTVQVLIAVSHFFSRKNQMKIVRPHHFLRYCGQITANGIPSFFNEFANGFIVLLFNIQFLKYCGETSLSVYSVVSNCVILFNSLFTGVGQAITPIVSTNYGAGKIQRISLVKKLAYTTIIICGTIFSLSGILFPKEISSIFLKPTTEINTIADSGLRLYFLAFFPMGINLLTSYYLQSVVKIKQSLCISLLRNIFLSSILILVFPLVFSSDSLWIVMPVTELCVMILSLIIMFRIKKSTRKNQA